MAKLGFLVLVLCVFGPPMISGALSPNFYQTSCPDVKFIAEQTVIGALSSQRSLGPALIRMFFHDCFVRGCDGSVLIKSPNGTAERDGRPNVNSLRGFEVIDEMKAALQVVCPNTVSCADAVALAALYSFKALGGYAFDIQLGRRDGNVSLAAEANVELPSPFSNVSVVAAKFAEKGLNITDMTILSGAHTVGSAGCMTFSPNLYNNDTSYDPTYATYLKGLCSPTDNVTRVAMKPAPFNNATFDKFYYDNLLIHRGLFVSDRDQLNNSTTLAVVDKEAFTFSFLTDFGHAMIKMGTIGVLTGLDGSIHTNCSSPTG